MLHLMKKHQKAKQLVYKPGDVKTITEDITPYPVFKEAQIEKLEMATSEIQ